MLHEPVSVVGNEARSVGPARTSAPTRGQPFNAAYINPPLSQAQETRLPACLPARLRAPASAPAPALASASACLPARLLSCFACVSKPLASGPLGFVGDIPSNGLAPQDTHI